MQPVIFISVGITSKSLNFDLFQCTHYKSYRKVPKFWDARKLCCNLPKIQTKRSKLRVFCQNGANGIANSEDPDQTAPLEEV